MRLLVAMNRVFIPHGMTMNGDVLAKLHPRSAYFIKPYGTFANDSRLKIYKDRY